MFHIEAANPDKKIHYQELLPQLRALLDGETNWIANLAQFSAFIFYSLPDLNWAGFYLYQNGELIVGPFQGKPACVHIPLGKGVCGVSAEKRQTIIVEDVQQFPGHITCDTASRSEIVIPMIKNHQLIGVLDIDSPTPGRFDLIDQKGLNALLNILLEITHTS